MSEEVKGGAAVAAPIGGTSLGGTNLGGGGGGEAAKKRKKKAKKPAKPAAGSESQKEEKKSSIEEIPDKDDDCSDCSQCSQCSSCQHSSQSSESENEDESDYRKGGYHRMSLGDRFRSRYKVVKKLGWGHFSTVWLVFDSQTSKFVAMKVVKSASHYTEAALDEIQILKKIASQSPSSTMYIIHLYDNFIHRGPHGEHVCMVFESLGCNLFQIIKRRHYRGFSLRFVKEITRQVLHGLSVLHDDCGIIHTDLKPENILLVPPKNQYEKLLASQTRIEAQIEEMLIESDLGESEKKERPDEARDKNEDGSEQKMQDTDDKDECAGAKAEKPQALSKNQKKKLRQASMVQPPSPKSPSQSEDKNFKASSKGRGGGESAQDQNKDASKPRDPRPEISVRYLPVKIADLGNACWVDKHFTHDIQTRPYRAPEVIVRANYGPSCDIWSVACIVFELLTGDLLFNARSSRRHRKSDDHFALILELLEKRRAPEYLLNGKYSADFFNRKGEFKPIRNLKYWGLKAVLMEKYHYSEDDAQNLTSFLLPMLTLDPRLRIRASEALRSKWLNEDDERELTTSEKDLLEFVSRSFHQQEANVHIDP